MPEQGERRVAGAVFFGVCAVLLLVGAYLMWPPHMFAGGISGITGVLLVRAVTSLALVFIGLEFAAALAVVLMSDR